MQKKFQLKNGKEILIRTALAEDTAAAVEYFDKISRQTIYTLQYPGQPKKDVEKTKEGLTKSGQVHFVALDGDEIVGMSTIFVPRFGHPWAGHIGQFGIHMLEQVRGQGLGSYFMELIEIWARDNNIHRIEGHVRTQNRAGISLYLKHGFVIEGMHSHKALIAGVWHDEYSIAKILN